MSPLDYDFPLPTPLPVKAFLQDVSSLADCSFRSAQPTDPCALRLFSASNRRPITG